MLIEAVRRLRVPCTFSHILYLNGMLRVWRQTGTPGGCGFTTTPLSGAHRVWAPPYWLQIVTTLNIKLHALFRIAACSDSELATTFLLFSLVIYLIFQTWGGVTF